MKSSVVVSSGGPLSNLELDLTSRSGRDMGCLLRATPTAGTAYVGGVITPGMRSAGCAVVVDGPGHPHPPPYIC